jgi:hypothetical protein
MFDKLLIVLGLAVVLYVAWLFAYPYIFPKKDSFYTPSLAPLQEQQPAVEPARTVSPSGPASPNAADSSQETTISPEVRASDPYGESQESSNLQDNLRHPERMFSPGIKNTDTQMPARSGVGANEVMATPAIQTFSPEMAQNGAVFMDGVTANETASEYASF